MFGQFFHQHERHPAHDASSTKPKRGMIVAFKSTTEPELANIPARIVTVWPRFQSGECLVTLEYAAPVRLGNAFLRQIDAFASELYCPTPIPMPLAG
jgi:hypothetical protein